MGTAVRLGFLLVTAAANAGCGGSTDDDDEESCDVVTACGGDVVGLWNVSGLCVATQPEPAQPECAGAINYGSITASGQIEFTADGQVISSLDLNMHASYRINSECASAQAGGPVTVDALFCEEVENQLIQGGEVMNPSCTFSAAQCVCSASISESSGGQGMYSLDGTNLVGADGSVNPYCVSGSTLRITIMTPNGSMTYTLTRVTR